MAWKSFFDSATQDDDGKTVIVSVKVHEDGGQEFTRSYPFTESEPLTKAAVKAKVQPDLDAMNSALTKIANANTNLKGQDISLW